MTDIITHVGSWMHRYARNVDLMVWESLFEGEDNKKVADSLLYYQNEDGGIGRGLDPDNWNINSLPYASLYALDTLRMVGFKDLNHPIYTGIFKYLNNIGISNWSFTVPSNADYPHAVLYNHSEEYNKIESIGIITALSAYILRYGRKLSVYNDVIAELEVMVGKINDNKLGDMGPSGYIELVSAMEDVGITGYNYKELWCKITDIVNNTMQKSEEAWENYGYRPSDFIMSKNSPFIKGNEEYIDMECKYLYRTLPENDIWPVSWRWFDNAVIYPKEETVSLHIAKARKAIEHVLFIQTFE